MTEILCRPLGRRLIRQTLNFRAQRDCVDVPPLGNLPQRLARRDALDENLAFRNWDPELKALWHDLTAVKFRRELRFLHLTGLALCVCCLALDAQTKVLELGLWLRLGVTAPLYIAGIMLLQSSRRSVRAAAAIIPVAAFAATATYLGLAAGSAFADRYVLAASMLVTICVVAFPLRAGTLALALVGFCAIAVPLLLSAGAPAASPDMILFVFFCSVAPLPIKMRSDRVRDVNFILSLKARLAQDELLAINRQLEDLSSLDPLTGVLNRRGFEKEFDAAFGSVQSSGEPLALLLLDLDHFKSFNDTHGHQFGDHCLAEVGHVLKSEVERSNGFVGRYGGEEFIAVVLGAASANCVSLAQRICARVRDLVLIDQHGRPVSVTASMGIRIARSRTAVPSALIGDADRALYAAKRAGRDRVVLFTDEVESAEPDPLDERSQSEARCG